MAHLKQLAPSPPQAERVINIICLCLSRRSKHSGAQLPISLTASRALSPLQSSVTLRSCVREIPWAAHCQVGSDHIILFPLQIGLERWEKMPLFFPAGDSHLALISIIGKSKGPGKSNHFQVSIGRHRQGVHFPAAGGEQRKRGRGIGSL